MLLGNMRILALDTLFEGKPEGHLCDQRLAWLADRLETPFPGLTWILMHHPPFPSGIAPLDRMSLVGGKQRFAALIARYAGALRILSGHIHRPYQALWNGAFCAVAGSPAFQVALQFSDPEEPPVSAEPYAWYLHAANAEGLSVHARHVEL
jgi:Icc protein